MRHERRTLTARAETHHGVHHLVGATRPVPRCIDVEGEHSSTPNSQRPNSQPLSTSNSQELPNDQRWELGVGGGWELEVGSWELFCNSQSLANFRNTEYEFISEIVRPTVASRNPRRSR